jgi:hypothetical protein
MTGRRTVILVAALAVLVVGCSAADTAEWDQTPVEQSGSITAPDPTSDDDESDEGSTVGDIAAGAMSDATRALCATERRTLEVAVDAYTVMTGSTPASVEEMVGEFLREAPGELDIGPDGAIRAIPGGRCA